MSIYTCVDCKAKYQGSGNPLCECGCDSYHITEEPEQSEGPYDRIGRNTARSKQEPWLPEQSKGDQTQCSACGGDSHTASCHDEELPMQEEAKELQEALAKINGGEKQYTWNCRVCGDQWEGWNASGTCHNCFSTNTYRSTELKEETQQSESSGHCSSSEEAGEKCWCLGCRGEMRGNSCFQERPLGPLEVIDNLLISNKRLARELRNSKKTLKLQQAATERLREERNKLVVSAEVLDLEISNYRKCIHKMHSTTWPECK